MGESLGTTLGRGLDPQWKRELEIVNRAAESRRAMDALAARDREALVLWNGGMGYQEIAERTGQATDAVGACLARARTQLVMAYDLLDA